LTSPAAARALAGLASGAAAGRRAAEETTGPGVTPPAMIKPIRNVIVDDRTTVRSVKRRILVVH
jgi:hypothetical protein